ncbi:HAD family hydrolase [Embleya sp. NBC_00896]|uniref:HAD family hydrolase n=1 Tax=Embleya sp. NBC_00896 TaxID=2975961 RepID=UPI0038644162|nr:beta-phosphoglucomutase family hydrolase [Embleya sp. NBC_00896]
MLGLPNTIHALLFDLDGVLTQTAKVHGVAWKEMFDHFLRERDGADFTPFDPRRDYDRFVDGKQRLDGTRSFLESRGIHLSEGKEDDAPGTHTLYGLSNAKNDLVLRLIRDRGVEVYEGSVRYVHAARAAKFPCAVVSSSANAEDVLRAAGMYDLFDAIVDGVVAKRDGLKGKPAPDSFLAGAEALGVAPANAAVFEDALAGVGAGRAGDFGHVIGVDRVGQADALLANGADIVVQDLDELLDPPDQDATAGATTGQTPPEGTA